MNFQQNYIKYKKKYLKLKKIQEGGVACNLAYKNIHGTCWMVATITCLCFGWYTSRALEKVMNSFKIDNQYKSIDREDKIDDLVKDDFEIFFENLGEQPPPIDDEFFDF